MVVFTTVEWVPGLMVDGTDYAWLMVVPLLVCNTYQMLTLHRLPFVEKEPKKEQKSASKPKKGKRRKCESWSPSLPWKSSVSLLYLIHEKYAEAVSSIMIKGSSSSDN